MQTDICVIGAGPAGSSAARQLARLGHRVCVVERAVFPRRHIGESLQAGVLPLLDVLDICQRIEMAGFLRPDGALVRWGNLHEDGQSRPREAGFQVDRGRFDLILLEAAQEAGAQVLQPVAAKHPIRLGPQAWRIPVMLPDKGLDFNIETRFIVDATGRRSLLGGRMTRCSVPTLALYGYWEAAPLAGPETRIEAGTQAWYWGAPLPDQSFNATVFIDPARCAAAGRHGLESLYKDLLAKSTLLQACLRGRLMSRVRGCDAASHATDDVVGMDWIKIGEAAFSIDPLASQGIQAALRTGIQSAIVINTVLRTPDHSEDALQFYRQRQDEVVAFHQTTASQFYAEQARLCSDQFWQQRQGGPSASESKAALPRQAIRLVSEYRLHVSPHAVLASTPVVEGDIITSHLALCHPQLERPVAFLHGVAIVPLLAAIDGQRSAADVLTAWLDVTTRDAGRDILRWLWMNGIVV